MESNLTNLSGGKPPFPTPEQFNLDLLSTVAAHPLALSTLLLQSGGSFTFYLPGEQLRRSIRQQPNNCLQASERSA
jgi:hypothetical protein